jgi:hypothetical protein
MGSQGKAHPELPVKLLVHLKLREVLKPPGLPQIDDRRRVLSHPERIGCGVENVGVDAANWIGQAAENPYEHK